MYKFFEALVYFSMNMEGNRAKENNNILKPEPRLPESGDFLTEYEFDYRKAKPNRFAIKDQERVIILEPDVAEYFHDSESVNRVLRALIEVIPRAASR